MAVAMQQGGSRTNRLPILEDWLTALLGTGLMLR
jgi:hypothetical protein